ncbi:hypothetical protein [Pseudomonas sp. MN1F]|uniref:hypothetical protein n=1 Tax=Pseudomonas sp. MN1F TaxID=1366632 RepID=UPI00128EFC22|nr:hypothetical protein [Pseudomonas sp. MN1F]MQG94274.1 hypothetical protein [Pseudomonas sp. MN1F]
MSQANTAALPGRTVRPRLFWRLLFAQVLLLGAFLYLSLITLAGYLLLLGFDAEQQQSQRLMALAGGGLILLVGLWLLKVAMPRRISPLMVEPER